MRKIILTAAAAVGLITVTSALFFCVVYVLLALVQGGLVWT